MLITRGFVDNTIITRGFLGCVIKFSKVYRMLSDLQKEMKFTTLLELSCNN